MTIKIIPNDRGNSPGKLADAELHFTDGPLAGLKLIGFGVWERRVGKRSKRHLSGQNLQHQMARDGALVCCALFSILRVRTASVI